MTNTKYLLIVLICFLQLALNAQSLLSEGNQWFITTSTFVPTPNTRTNAFRIGSDTVFNNVVYKKIERINDSLQVSWMDIGRYIREEDEQKVYVFRENFGETMLYDFSLEVGDTFQTSCCNLIVTEIDSIQLLNGEMRKKLKLVSDPPAAIQVPSYWIEGIGSNFGLLDYDCFTCLAGLIDANSYLSCFQQNNELVYVSENANQCWVVSLTDEMLNKTAIDLFPNPFQDKITITSSVGHTINQIQIFSTMGQLIRTIQIADNNAELDMSELGSGAYYILGQMENGDVFSEKLIKLE